MISFEKKRLANGLTVIVHEDFTTPLCVCNILYKVGSRNEKSAETGFAHLFEHFMFEGSANILEFDTHLENAGGENNAFTTNDFTNYYEIVPAENLETALWLESDRMLSLAFDSESLELQKKVVSEEFKEHYINQPYGDVWHLLMGLAYSQHPYQWPVIGKNLAHIEQANMTQVKDFFFTFYRPNNAILVLGGNVKSSDAFGLAEKWFGDIPAGEKEILDVLPEPIQTAENRKEVFADVPADALYIAYKMCGRAEENYQALDLFRDLLSTGDSSKLYLKLVKELKIFSTVSAYLTETIDPGLFVIEGKLHEGKTLPEAELAIKNCLTESIENLSEKELQKIKNKAASFLAFSDATLLNRCTNLAIFEFYKNADLVNSEKEKYEAVTISDMQRAAKDIFKSENCNVLFYQKKLKNAE